MAVYQHVVFATDLTDAAPKAARRAAEVARCFGARLTLMHVIEHFPEDLSVSDIPPTDVDPETYLKRRADERLATLARDVDAADAARHVGLSRGSAKHEILRLVREVGADLIVMGAVGHPGMLGTTVNGVTASAPCDVMVIQGAVPE